MSIWTREISWKWPAAFGTAVLLVIAVLWLLGLDSPRPQFKLDPTDPGAVVPVHWPWWRRAADWLHGRRYLVLSFDDGPADHHTDARILQILAKHHAHAIFFTICGHAYRNGHLNPTAVADLRADVSAGDLIGDHTFTHPHLPTLNRTQLTHQIAGCQTMLEQVTGQQVHWFRPPFGQYSPAVLAVVKQADMRMVLWGDNSQDSWQFTPAEIRHWSTTMATNDSILLMHSRSTTAAALDRTLTTLERMGYQFVLPETPATDGN